MFELDTLQGHHTSTNYHDDSSHASEDSSSRASSCCSEPFSGNHQHHGDTQPQRTICLLGTRLARHDTSAIRQFQRKLYWMTYRNELVVGLRPYCGGGKFVGVGGGGGVSFGGRGEDLTTNPIEATSGLKTDAGWGCMLRSAQMMLAQTIRVHFSGRDAAEGLDVMGSSSSFSHRCHDLEEIRIATWFADFPNPDLALDEGVSYTEESSSVTSATNERQLQHSKSLIDNHHWYSLHQMVAAGLGLGVLPGEWYGPTTACHVLRELNELHHTYLENKMNAMSGMDFDNHAKDLSMFRIHIATEGCIYRDAVNELMIQNSKTSEQSSGHEEDYSLVTVDDPLRMPTKENEQQQEWDTALLLLLPLRLGIHSIPASLYGGTLSKLLQFSQSVGMLGGTPRHALWFYGADDVGLLPSEEGKEDDGGWYGLDPHVVQTAPRGELIELSSIFDNDSVNNTASASNDTRLNNINNSRTNKRYRWRVHLDETYLRSLHISPTTSHSNHEKSIPLSKLDPSLALGFYFHNHTDFASFRESLNALNTLCRKNKLPELVTVLDKAPNYEVDVSAFMKNMSLTKGRCREVNARSEEDLDGFSIKSEEDGFNEEQDDVDDDEYVLV